MRLVIPRESGVRIEIRAVGGVVRFDLAGAVVLVAAWVNELRIGYNYAYHLVTPINAGGRNWVSDIGLRNLASGSDPLEFGRPSFTISGFSGQGDGTLTRRRTNPAPGRRYPTMRIVGPTRPCSC